MMMLNIVLCLMFLVHSTLGAEPSFNCMNIETNKPCGSECGTKAGCWKYAPSCYFYANHKDNNGDPAWCYYPAPGPTRNCWNKDTTLPCGSECATEEGCAAHTLFPGCTFEENHNDMYGNPAWCYYPVPKPGRNCWNKNTGVPCGGECATESGCKNDTTLNLGDFCIFEVNHTDHDGKPAWCFYPEHAQGGNCWNKDSNLPCGDECASLSGCLEHAPGCSFDVNHIDHDGKPAWCYYADAAPGRNCWNNNTNLPCGSECATKVGCSKHAPTCQFKENHFDHNGNPAWCFYPDTGPSPAPGPDNDKYALGMKYLGAMCDGLTSKGCNPFQLPLYDATESFVPSLLVSVDKSSIFLDTTQSTSIANNVKLSQSASAVSSSDASGFGIGASGTFDHILFSLGLSHQELVNKMHTSTSVNFYSEISRKYTVFTTSIDGTVPLKPSVAADVAALPAAASTPEDQQKWFSFFSKYGTHYVKSVSFGGEMKMYTFVESAVTKDAKVSSNDWNFNLGAQFMQLAGIDFTWGSQSQKDSFNAFSGYTFNQQFFSLGGDQSVSKYDQWLGTVKANPAPIHTSIGPLKDFIDASKDYDSAFAAYVQYCPNTEAGGICNGFGGCNFKTQTCNCVQGTEVGDGGNCYPTCQNNCNGNGVCTDGICQCNVNADGFGWSGNSCQTKCGSKTFDAGSNHVWNVPGDPEKIMDRCTSASCDNYAGATCWCRSKDDEPDWDDGMVASYADQQNCWNTYKCGAADNHCSTGHWPWSGWCNCVQVITCSYGQGQACNNANTLTENLLKGKAHYMSRIKNNVTSSKKHVRVEPADEQLSDAIVVSVPKSEQ